MQSHKKEKKNEAWDIMLPDFRCNQNSMVSPEKHTHRSVDQNREPWENKEQRINSCTYGQLIYEKEGKNIRIKIYGEKSIL